MKCVYLKDVVFDFDDTRLYALESTIPFVPAEGMVISGLGVVESVTWFPISETLEIRIKAETVDEAVTSFKDARDQLHAMGWRAV